MLNAPAGRTTLALNRQSAVPIYHQFKRMVLDQIISGDLPPGARLPTEHEYARQLGVSLAPIRQALRELAQLGYVERVKSRGTFVRQRKIEQKITVLSSFTDSMHQMGLPVRLEVRRLERCRPSTEVATQLNLTGRDMVVVLQRRCFLEQEPLALLQSYLPAAIFPHLEQHDFGARSLYHLLEEEYGCVLTRAESCIDVCPADEERSALLAVSLGAPLIRVESLTHRHDDQVVEYVEVLYRADRYRLFIESRREEDGIITSNGYFGQAFTKLVG
ncbi:MAG TPA: GntR family transcriptional regulator [Chloroflexota bacterium]|nr:GntR family transcriptional regulator [Chloroflexota bacterium]